jgi:hypothetical protein
MTVHNLLLHERSRQEQAKQLRFRKLFHIGRPVTVLSVALLAATAVIGSTINTMSYLDSISAALPVPTTHRVTARRSANTQSLVLVSSVSSDLSGQVLGTSVIAPAPSTEAQINVAAMTSTIASLVNNLVNQYLSQGLLTGPAGPPGPSGLTPGFSGPNGMVQNGNGQTTSVIGGTPIVSYIPASQGNGNYTGGSLAGFTNLSGQNLTANTENVTDNLTVQGSSSFGSATFSGSASVAGTFSAATSTFSTLTVSGPATFTGSTTIAGLTVTGFNPGLTLGSVAFQGASALAQDNANFFYDSTNHRLGLGTTTPGSQLVTTGGVQFSNFGTGLLHANNVGLLSSSAVNLSTGDVTGVLPVGNGGLGTTTLGSLTVGGNLSISGGQQVLIGTSTQISLVATGTPGSYGSASQIPVMTTNSYGEVIAVTNTNIAISTTSVSGIWAVAQGGTGSSSFTSNGILYGNGTSAIQATAAGTNNYLLYSNNGIPAWTNAPTVLGTNITSLSASNINTGILGVLYGGTGATTATGATASLQFQQTAASSTVRSLSDKLADSVSVKDFGATGNGTTDDTIAIQAAINTANLTGRVVYAPPGNYKITGTLNIYYDGLKLVGDGELGTKFNFYPTTDNQKLFNIYHASGTGSYDYIYDIHLENFGVALEGTSHPAVAFFTRNGSNISFNHIGVWQWNDATGQSIGLQTQGREYLIVDNTTIVADLPWSLEKNPDYPSDTEDCDFCHVSNSSFVAVSTQPSIKIADGAKISNVVIENTSLGSGSYGIYWSDTTAASHSHDITIRNVRWEGSTNATGYSVYINRAGAQPLTGLTLDGLMEANAGITNGIYLHGNISGGELTNTTCQYGYSGSTCIDINSTVANFYVDKSNTFNAGSFNGPNTLTVTVGDTQDSALAQKWQNSAGTALAVVDKNGHIGIATSTPAFPLDVDGIIASGYYAGSGEIRQYSNSTFYQSLKNDSVTAHKSGLYTSASGGTDNFLLYYNTGTGDTGLSNLFGGANIVFNTDVGGTLTQQMTILNNGNVGIGTTSPAQKLDVWGNLNVATSSTPALFVNTANTRVGIGTATPIATLAVKGSGSTNPFTVASSSGAIMLTIAPSGNVGIGTNTVPTLGPLVMNSGAYVTTGGVWTNVSDRNLKENFATMTPADILQKIDQLPVTEWNYKSEGPSVKHIGPVAQDFWALFQVGNSSTTISTVDPGGIALLGIQALDEKITALQGSLTGNATTTNLTVYNPGNFSGDSVGEAKILSGQTSVRITFAQPYAYQPIVTATPVGDSALADGFRFTLEDIDASGFTIQTLLPVTSDTSFDWHSFASPTARLTVSDGSTAPISLIVPPAAPPAPPIITDPATTGDPLSTPDSTASTTPASAADSSTPPVVLGASTSTPPVAPSPSAPLTAPPPPPPPPVTSQSSSAAPAPSTPSDAAMSPAN